MKKQQDIIALAAVQAAKLATDKAAAEIQSDLNDRLAGQAAEHTGDVDALRSQADGFGEQIATLVDSVAAAHQAAQTVDGELSLALAETEDRIKADVSGVEQRLDEKAARAIEEARSGFAAMIDSKRAELLKTLVERTAEVGKTLGQVQAAFEAEIRAAQQATEEKFSERVEHETNGLALTIESRLKWVEAKRDALEELARRVNEEFGTLAEGMSQAMLTAATQQQELRNEYEAWVKAMVNDAKSSVETTAQLLLEETRDARDQIVDDVFDTAKEYVESLKIPDPIPGEKGDPGARGEKGDPGRDGAVTAVSKWQHSSYYSKDTAVSHFGGLWIATCNTDTEPGKSDAWINMVRGIEATSLDEHGSLLLRMSDGHVFEVGNVRGPAGREWEHKGVYDADGWYIKGDVVILKGSSYVAVVDSPGACPGEGWKMLAQAQKGPAGKPGKQGKAGDPGPPGPVGPPGAILRWRGAYSTGETYRENDITSYNGAVWIALQTTSAVPKADGVNWDPMIRKPSASGGGGNVASAIGSLTIVSMNQAAYDALPSPDANTLYLICEGTP